MLAVRLPSSTLIQIVIKGSDHLALSKLKSTLNAYPNALTLEKLIPIPDDYYTAKDYADNMADDLLTPRIRLHKVDYAAIEEEMHTLKDVKMLDILAQYDIRNNSDIEVLLDLYIKATGNFDPTHAELLEWVDSSYKPADRAHELYLERFRLSLSNTRSHIKLAKNHGYTTLHGWKLNNFGYTASPVIRRIELIKTGNVSTLCIDISNNQIDYRVLLKSLCRSLPEFDVDIQVEDGNDFKLNDKSVAEFFDVGTKPKCTFGTINSIDQNLYSIVSPFPSYGGTARLLARIDGNPDNDSLTLTISLLSVTPRKQFTIDSAVYDVTDSGPSEASTIANCINDNEHAIIAYFGKYITFRKAYGISRDRVNKLNL